MMSPEVATGRNESEKFETPKTSDKFRDRSAGKALEIGMVSPEPNLLSLSTEHLIRWLTVPDGRFGADPIAGRDALLRRTLDQALSELERRLGPDMEHWRYGQARLKHIRIGHPLSEAVRPDLRSRLD
jgi:acyl-homoserine lactone acylase PvdQ